jgi:hypothetical protein
MSAGHAGASRAPRPPPLVGAASSSSLEIDADPAGAAADGRPQVWRRAPLLRKHKVPISIAASLLLGAALGAIIAHFATRSALSGGGGGGGECAAGDVLGAGLADAEPEDEAESANDTYPLDTLLASMRTEGGRASQSAVAESALTPRAALRVECTVSAASNSSTCPLVAPASLAINQNGVDLVKARGARARARGRGGGGAAC